MEIRKERLRGIVNETAKSLSRNRERLERIEHEKTELYMKYALGEITEEEYIQKSESNVQKMQMIKDEIAG